MKTFMSIWEGDLSAGMLLRFSETEIERKIMGRIWRG